MLNTNTLKKYADAGYNVLLTGKHGVGKTAIIKEVFNEKYGPVNVNWKYFSASTLDPFIDLVGIPKNFTNKDGEEVFKIIPPEYLTGAENIQALFFDEINRAEEKTMNAIMELIQFRSINGRKFPNLKVIWAAENPADDDDHNYSVRELDPAQRDRFHIQLTVPYDLDKKYFAAKFGDDIFSVAKEWWHSGKVKKDISPRKLDSILDGFMCGFDINDFSNIVKLDELKNGLSNVGLVTSMLKAAQSGDPVVIKNIFTVDNLRANEIAIKTKKKVFEIFDPVYPHVDGEIQDYISRTFKYTFIQKRSSQTLTATQMAYLNAPVKNIAFKYDNIKEILNHIDETVSVFDYNIVKDTELMDVSDMSKLFQIDFDDNFYSKQNESNKFRQYLDEGKYTNHENFRSYVKLLACVVENINKYHTGEHEIVDKILDFLTNALDNALASAALSINIIHLHKMRKSLAAKEEMEPVWLEKFKYEKS